MTRVGSVVALLLTLGHSLLAQEVRGTVRDSVSNQPIPAAVLLLLDASGTPLGRNITNERGEFRIVLSPRTDRVRVVRIGFRPRELSAIHRSRRRTDYDFHAVAADNARAGASDCRRELSAPSG